MTHLYFEVEMSSISIVYTASSVPEKVPLDVMVLPVLDRVVDADIVDIKLQR